MSDSLSPVWSSKEGFSVAESEDNQLIDLTELYSDTQQDHALHMVQGAESLGLGKLTRSLAIQMGLPRAREMDPFATARNAVIGNEGFFQTLADGFKKIIENIIRYIKIAINWIVDGIKGLLGFRKSDRINKAINDSFGNLREEFRTVAKGLGFPDKDYSLEAFIGEFPESTDRLGQVVIMRTKFETDEGAIKNITEALPLFTGVISKFADVSNKVGRARENFSRTLRDEYTKTRARHHLGEHVQGDESPECNRIMKAAAEVLITLDVNTIRQEVTALVNKLYKVEFKNEGLSEGFNKFRTDLDALVTNHTAKLGEMPKNQLLTSIQYMNKQYVEMNHNVIDMSRVNFRDLGKVVDKDDAEKIQSLSQYYGHRGLLETYNSVAVATREFTDFCQMTSRQLLRIENQIKHLVDWYHRNQLWYYHGLLDNFEELAKLNQEARAAGHSPVADAAGNPTYAMDFIPEADVKTFLEKASLVSNEVLMNNIAGLKDRYNNLVNQTGLGKKI